MVNKQIVKNDDTISFIRLISTVMIVVLHILQRIGGFDIVTDWLNLGVVFFFCISAHLYSKRNIKNSVSWFKKKYIEIVIPSFVVVVLTLLVFFSLVETVSTNNVINSLLSGLGFEAFLKDSYKFKQYWFLTYILIAYLLVPFLQKIKVKDISNFVFWVGLIVSTILIQVFFALLSFLDIPSISYGVMLRFILPYLVFKKYCDDIFSYKKLMIFLSYIAVFALVMVCFIRYFDYIIGMEAICELIFIYTQTLVGFVAYYWLYKLFSNKRFNAKLLSYSDKLSYPIYLTHCLFIGYDTSVMFSVGNMWIGIILALFLTLISSVVVVWISNPIKKFLLKYI